MLLLLAEPLTGKYRLRKSSQLCSPPMLIVLLPTIPSISVPAINQSTSLQVSSLSVDYIASCAMERAKAITVVFVDFRMVDSEMVNAETTRLTVIFECLSGVAVRAVGYGKLM